MKKILTSLLTIVLIVSLFPTSYASNNCFSFELNSDGRSYSVRCTNIDICGEVIIPSEYDGKPVTIIGGNAFEKCSYLESVIIPSSITIIAGKAFYTSYLCNIYYRQVYNYLL